MSHAVYTDELMEEVRQRWDRGESPDASTVLMEHPEFTDRKSLLLELAYEEYFRRVESGDNVEIDSFCRRFPACRLSLQRRIEVHQFLQDESSWAAEIPWPKANEEYLRFQLLEELGRGVASRVFLARERDLSDRLVVVKVSTHGYREAQILSRLEHPHIVPVYSVERDEENDLVAICMPFLTRWTLLDLLDAAYGGGNPPARFAGVLNRLHELKPRGGEAVRPARIDPFLRRATFVDGLIHLMVQLADALDHTHRHGVLHLDLKPTNILLTPEGRPLLLDFNLAIEDPAPQSVLGGTLPYMSPEQIRSTLLDEVDDACAVDCRSDVYSLGVVFCELLSGAHPFGPVSRGELPSELARPLLERQRDLGRRDLSKISGVDTGLSRTVRHCLETDPQHRPQTAADLREELGVCLNPGRRLLRWSRCHPWWVAVAAVLFVAVFAAAVSRVLLIDSYAETQYKLGVARCDRHEYREAIEFLDQAIGADQDKCEYWFQRARARQRLKEFRGAVGDYARVHRLTQDPLYLASMGYCLARIGDREAAFANYRSAVDNGSGTAEVLAGLGFCYLKLQMYAEANECLTEAIARKPELAKAHYIQALVLSKLAAQRDGDHGSRAVAAVQRALDLGLTEPSVMHDAADIYYNHWLEVESKIRNERVLDLLAEAVRNGYAREDLAAWKNRPGIGDTLRFQQILDLPQVTRQVVDDFHMLPDPVPDSARVWMVARAATRGS